MPRRRWSVVVLVGTLCLVWASRGVAQVPRWPEGFKAELDVAYGPHERNKLDVYYPEKADKPLPLVIWIHGGAWRAGDKKGAGPALPLTGKGFAVASVNYRYSQQAPFPAQIEDCKAAVRFLRANAKKYNIDPDHFGVWGSSAGGHLVALLGTSGDVKELEGDGGHKEVSSRVQAVCDWFGPTDLLQMGGTHDNPNSPESVLIGGAIQDNKEKATKANPIVYVTKDDPPFLIMHGDKDGTVPPNQSELIQEALKKAGVETTLKVIKDAGHGGPGFNTPENAKLIEEFFTKHLKGGVKP